MWWNFTSLLLPRWLWMTAYQLFVSAVCLPSGHSAVASGIKPTDLHLQWLYSSNVYFYLIMALKCQVLLTKKRCEVFYFNEKHSKICWERGHIYINSNTVCCSNDFKIVILFSLCPIHKLNFTICIQYGLQSGIH